MNQQEAELLLATYGLRALKARKQLIELLMLQDKEIRQIFTNAADDLAAEIKRLESIGNTSRISGNLDDVLRKNALTIEKNLKNIFDDGLSISVEAGMHQSKQTTLSLFNKAKIDWKPIERSFFRQHTTAVEAMQNRTIKGLNLSDRIWGQSQKARSTMGSIIEDAIAAGEHPYKVAGLLQQYVRNGANSLVAEYPNMIERLEGNIPMDLSYESLRLARTEMAAAFGEGSTRSAELNPSNIGMQWALSNAGFACSVCMDNAEHDSGLGKGIYKLEDLPDYPAHPNCLCILAEVVEDTDDFVERLIEWNHNPQSHPDLEDWYQSIY